MVVRRSVLALGLVLCASGPALAACMDKSGGVTAAMLDCDRAELQRQDKRLNRAYQALMDTGTAEQKEALRASQRTWLAYREGTCQLHHVFGGGGTIDSIAASGCAVEVLARRVRFLETLAE